MKKLMLMTSVVGVFIFGVCACEKTDSDANPNNQSVSTNTANRVVFSTVEEYEQLFADPNQTDSLASGIAARYGVLPANARMASNLEDTLYPEFILNILNQDRIVQIQDWLIKVDAAKEQVLVLEKQYESEYEDLVNSNLSNVHLKVFSTNDEVITMLQNGLNSENTRLFCRENGAVQKENDGYLYTTDSSRFKLNVRYLKLGIYFELKASAKSESPGLLGIWQGLLANFKVEGRGKYKVACHGELPVDGYGDTNGHAFEANFKAYQGTNKLAKYQLNARIYLERYDSLEEFPIKNWISENMGIVDGF